MLQYFSDLPHQDMLTDIIDEVNRQGEQDATPLSIVAFGTKTITIGSNPNLVFTHGLGYAPLFQLFIGSLSLAGISPAPIIDYDNFFGPASFNGTVNAYADAANLYLVWNDQLQTPQQQVTYIVYNGPISGS